MRCAITLICSVWHTTALQPKSVLRVEVPLDATVGALRNAVNGALPRGYVIEEHDVVPKPFAHYVEDDPECFRGPADGWRLAEVFFDELAAEPLEAVRCRATAPLGPPRAVAVLFPGERAVTQRDFVGADAAFLEAAATLRGYAPRAALAGDERARRDAWVVLPLAALEAKLRSGQLARADVGAVCGFGALPASPSAVDASDGSRAGTAGETAALVFCGALSLEAALELVDARHGALKGVSAKAVSVVGDADVEDARPDLRGLEPRRVNVQRPCRGGPLRAGRDPRCTEVRAGPSPRDREPSPQRKSPQRARTPAAVGVQREPIVCLLYTSPSPRDRG